MLRLLSYGAETGSANRICTGLIRTPPGALTLAGCLRQSISRRLRRSVRVTTNDVRRSLRLGGIKNGRASR